MAKMKTWTIETAADCSDCYGAGGVAGETPVYIFTSHIVAVVQLYEGCLVTMDNGDRFTLNIKAETFVRHLTTY